MLALGFLAVMGLGVVKCSNFFDNAARIEGVGYYKDSAMNRVQTFSFDSTVTEAEIRTHAERQTSAPGQLTAAYYYPSGSVIPADGITRATRLDQVNEVLYETPGLSRWRYAFMRPIIGDVQFVDCEATPKDGLCRP